MRLLDHQAIEIHFLALAAFSATLFMPMMGRGFILDDFGHLFVASQESVRFGLLRASGGPFYAPVAYVSFKIDWLLWGARPFLWALTNLLIHIVNTLLLYVLVLQLWRSRTAAWWTAFGFALLFPANVGAIMFIATRAHIIAALFYLAAILAALWFTRTERFKLHATVAVAAFAALSMFAKESGVTVLAAVAIMIFYERGSQGRRVDRRAIIALFVLLFAVLALYLMLRARSGAIPISFSAGTTYQYLLSPRIVCENLLMYALRTYGLLSLITVAVLISLRMRGRRVRLGSLTSCDILFSVMLFTVALIPVVLIRKRPEVYSYLPGIGAALLLGAVARSLDETPSGTAPPPPRSAPVTLVPIIFVVALYTALTVVYSLKWIQLAEVNTAVLRQIAAEQPEVKPNTFILLTYSKTDRTDGFPDGFSSWCFPWALRTLYADRTIDGKIIGQGESYSIGNKLSEVRFSYVKGGTPTVVKTGEVFPNR